MKSIFQTLRPTFFCASLLAGGALLASCAPQDSSQNAAGNGASAQNGSAQSGEAKTVVGFSQIGAGNAWRIANTKSIKDEAAKRGIDLQFSDAQEKQENQIKAIRSFVAQGVDAIAYSPVVETGWEPVLREAKAAKIPVFLTDRSVDVSDETLYTAFIGSDFIDEGKRGGEWLAKKTGGKSQIAELQGTAGASPTIDRKKGFDDAIKKFPGMKIIKTQNADYTRAKGKEVMESYLKSPAGKSITAVYAHNDDMAMGAIQAIEEAGKKPGKDILIVSVDGIKDAFAAMKAGKLNCIVECSPALGPDLFDAVAAVKAGKTVPRRITAKEGLFDETTPAKDMIGKDY